MARTWTEERVELIKKYWADGDTASLIAHRIGGVTRNAVIGKLSRLGLSRGHTPTRNYASRIPKRGPKPRQHQTNRQPTREYAALQTYSSEPPPPIQKTDIARVTFAELEEHHCRFYIGDPLHEGTGFCGDHKVPGLPYCKHHARRCYEPPKPRIRKPTNNRTKVLPGRMQMHGEDLTRP